VQAGLPAQVFGPGAQPLAGAPTADPQFSSVAAGYEPVIGALHFSAADVA